MILLRKNTLNRISEVTPEVAKQAKSKKGHSVNAVTCCFIGAGNGI